MIEFLNHKTLTMNSEIYMNSTTHAWHTIWCFIMPAHHNMCSIHNNIRSFWSSLGHFAQYLLITWHFCLQLARLVILDTKSSLTNWCPYTSRLQEFYHVGSQGIYRYYQARLPIGFSPMGVPEFYRYYHHDQYLISRTLHKHVKVIML